MISSIFKLTKVRRRKLKDMVSFFFKKEMKYNHMNGRGLIRFGSNIFTYIFKPSFIHISEFVLGYLSPKIHQLNNSNEYVPLMNGTSYIVGAMITFHDYELVDKLFSMFTLRRYNLSMVQDYPKSLRSAFRQKALKEAVVIDNFNNILFGYVRDKYSAGKLDIFEMFEYAASKLSVNAKRFESRMTDTIVRELSVFRYPPNSVFHGMLKRA
jgi:hypothetical protein